MNVIENIGAWIDRLMPLLSMLFAFISWVVGFWQRKVLDRLKRNRFERLIGIEPKSVCELIMPIRHGKLLQRYADQEFMTTADYHYVTLDESLAIVGLSRLLPDAKITMVKSMEQMLPENNKFCIGSILSNEYTVRFFKGETGVKLRGGFLRGSSEASLVEGPGSLLHIRELLTKRNNGRHAVFFKRDAYDNEPIEYPYDPAGDYLVWVKVTTADYGHKNHGTVHLIFGDKSNTATDAIQFISSHCDELYDILKKKGHLDHHFIVMRYSATQEFDLASLEDLTDVMLNPLPSSQRKRK